METNDFMVIYEKTGVPVFYGTKDECKKYTNKQYRLQGHYPEKYPEVDYDILAYPSEFDNSEDHYSAGYSYACGYVD